MMHRAVVVDTDRVRAVAELLKSTAVPAEAEESSPHGDVPRTVLPDLYLVLVAVCHQTSPVGQPQLAGHINGTLVKGWNYLREAFLRTAQRDPSWFAPSRLSAVTAADVDSMLQVGSDRAYLNNLEDRAALIRDLGQSMNRLQLASITDLFDRCQGTLMNPDGSGMLHELGKFRAYRDPVQKKSAFFLSLMQNQGLWVMRDPEHLPAPVDYHEVRGHLRCGTVRIADATLAELVSTDSDVSEEHDIQIRGAVSEAISAIGALSGLTPSRLHYLFWNVFRDCCKRQNPHCYECSSSCDLPARYQELTAGRRRCLFSEICVSRDNPNKIIEHRTTTDFY